MYNLIKCSSQYGRDEDMQNEMVHPPERPWKWFYPLYQKDCVEGNMVQERSGRVSLARTVLCWAHITFKRLLHIKSLVTIASHTNSSLHVCRFSSEPKKNWWMQSEKNKYSRESPDTDVFWASPCGDGTRKQAQNGGGAFSIGYVFSSWRFHGITYTLGTTGLFAAGIFGVGRGPKRKVPKPEKAPEKSPAPRVHKILQEWLKWHEQCDKRSFLQCLFSANRFNANTEIINKKNNLRRKISFIRSPINQEIKHHNGRELPLLSACPC